MAIGAAIAGSVAAIGGGILGKIGAGKAARAKERGAELIGTEFERTEEQMMPWLNVGQSALDRMAMSLGLPDSSGRTTDGRDFSEFYKSPGYQFRQEEGQKAVERSAAARGSLQSGATMKELQRFSQGLASSEFGNYMSQLSGLSRGGQVAATNLGQFRGAAASGRANLIAGAGEARASGYNALASGVQDLGMTWAGYAGSR